MPNVEAQPRTARHTVHGAGYRRQLSHGGDHAGGGNCPALDREHETRRGYQRVVAGGPRRGGPPGGGPPRPPSGGGVARERRSGAAAPTQKTPETGPLRSAP